MRSVDAARLGSPISEIVARVVHVCAPERIVLFGSYVYGTQTALSDVDLLIVCKEMNAEAPRVLDGAKRSSGAIEADDHERRLQGQ